MFLLFSNCADIPNLKKGSRYRDLHSVKVVSTALMYSQFHSLAYVSVSIEWNCHTVILCFSTLKMQQWLNFLLGLLNFSYYEDKEFTFLWWTLWCRRFPWGLTDLRFPRQNRTSFLLVYLLLVPRHLNQECTGKEYGVTSKLLALDMLRKKCIDPVLIRHKFTHF